MLQISLFYETLLCNHALRVIIKKKNAMRVSVGGADMTYQELLKKAIEDTGMTQKAFAEYFGIPVRTLQDWLAGKRKMPDYLLRLMIYKLEIEKKVEGLSEELED